MKKVAMVIASQGFRDEEYLQPKDILTNAGIAVTTASSSLNEARGMLGARAKPEVLLKDVKAADYDAVVFVGGMGAQEYWQDATAHRVAREFAAARKPVCAICIAPVILANAGLLEGRTATCFSSEAGQLRAKGANYTGKPVEKDGHFVTGEGPGAAKAFGETVLKVLQTVTA